MIDIAIVALYLAILVAIGLAGGRRVKSVSDFTACNTRYGPFVIFATLSASFIGGGYSSGNAAAAFENGIGTALTLFGFGIGMILIGRFVAPGVDRFTGASTVGGVIGMAYGEKARRFAGIFAFLCSAGIVGAQMQSIGLVLHALLGVTTTVGTLIGGGIVLLYTTFGGLGSVLVVDMLQFVLLAIGMPLLLLYAVWRGGGVTPLLNALPPSLLSPLNNSTLPAFLSLFLAMMCGEALAPPYMQRLPRGKHAPATAKGTIGSGLFSLPFFLITAGIGLAARALAVTDNAAVAMPSLILKLLPVGLRGLLMAAMVSIILSAADGFLNSATVSLVCDTVLPFYPLSDRTGLHVLRAVNLLTGGIAIVLSLCIPNVFSILLFAYSFWSPVLLVPLIAALRGNPCRTSTFFFGAIVGFTTAFLWNLTRPFGIDGCIIGTLCHLLIFLIGKRVRITGYFLHNKKTR